jgi:hypothetical protein
MISGGMNPPLELGLHLQTGYAFLFSRLVGFRSTSIRLCRFDSCFDRGPFERSRAFASFGGVRFKPSCPFFGSLSPFIGESCRLSGSLPLSLGSSCFLTSVGLHDG